MVMLAQPRPGFESNFFTLFFCIFSREASLPSSSPSLALFVNYPGEAVPRQLDRSNLEITRPIPRAPNLNTPTVASCHISPLTHPVCAYYQMPQKHRFPIFRAHLNTHTVKMCQISPEFRFLTLPSSECGSILFIMLFLK